MVGPGIERFEFLSSDGASLRGYRTGEGPPVLLLGGVGFGWRAWVRTVEQLRDHYRFLAWDYRGLSGPLGSPQLSPGDPVASARDALALLDAQGAERVALCSFAMGVQVALELFRLAPDRVAAIVCVNGVAGRPWRGTLHLPRLERALPGALRLSQKVPGVVGRLLRRAAQTPEALVWARRVGMAGKIDEERYVELAQSRASLDVIACAQMLESFGDHDAADVLSEVDVPFLVIVGDRDVLAPRRASEDMVARVPAAELMLIPGGGHLVLLEEPDLVSLRIEKFFRERGYGPVPRREAT